MRTAQREALLQRLIGLVNLDGGWGYGPRKASCPEPTSFACLALWAHGAESGHAARACQFMKALQREDGGVPACAAADAPCWVTGPAVLAWTLAESPQGRDRSAVDRAVQWLLSARGKPVAYNPTVFGHDTSLIGWSWVEGTHSWVEPTGYAVLALRVAGQGGHPRVREAVRLLLDRAIASGGWNYGNSRVFENVLRPFPGTTGVALCALAGEPPEPRIEDGIRFLLRELPSVRAPQSLAWAVMGLTAWGRRPEEASAWLEESADRCLRSEPNPLYDALLLLADAEPCPLTPAAVAVENAHG